MFYKDYYRTIRKLDDNVLHSDERWELNKLGRYLVYLEKRIKNVAPFGTLTTAQYFSLMRYLGEVRDLIIRKGGICDIH